MADTTRRATLIFDAGRPGLTADIGDPRTVAGLAVPYGIPGQTSAGRLRVRAGALRLPANLSRVKVFAGHDRERPVGYLTATDTGADGLAVVCRIAATDAGDQALLEAAEHVRDGFSVELDNLETTGDEVTGADLVALALVAMPAFADARVAMVAEETSMIETPAPAPEAAAQNATLATTLGELATVAAAGSAPAPAPADDAPDAGRMAQAARPPAMLTGSRRAGNPDTIMAAARQFAAAFRGEANQPAVMAAMTDVIPSNDAGAGLIRPQWLGELWQSVDRSRPFIDALTSRGLTGWPIQGWVWNVKPTVGLWAGNKTDIPSTAASTAPKSVTPQRIAGGNDVDRIFLDLGDPGFLASYFSMLTADYAKKSEDYVASGVIADAADAGAGATDVITGLDLLAQTLAANGAPFDWCGVAPNLWTSLLTMPATNAPWILSGTVNMRNQTGQVAGFNLFSDPAIPADTLIGGSRQAVDIFERTPPIQVQLANIPQGGVDLALFGYLAYLIVNPAAVFKVSTAPTIP